MKFLGKLLLFLCCLLSLFASMLIFYNQGIVADELSLGTAQLFGGDSLLMISWLRMLLLLAASILSFINLILHKKCRFGPL